MASLLGRLEAREAAGRARVEELRGEIATLMQRLTMEEEALSRLVVTRETVLVVLADEEDVPAAPLAAVPQARVGAEDLAGALLALEAGGDAVLTSPVYQAVLGALAVAVQPMRCVSCARRWGTRWSPVTWRACARG